MERATSRRDASEPTRPTAYVRLTGGSSEHASWLLQDALGGAAITIGSNPSCDWTIRAAGVPGHALSVLLLQGSIYVRSGEQGGVLLDGQPLDTCWRPVADGARLDIGFARLEIGLGDGRAPRPQSWVVHNVESRGEEHSAPSIVVDGEAIEAKLNADAEAAEGEQTRVDAADVSGIRETPLLDLQHGHLQHGVVSGSDPDWFARRSRPSLPDGPSLLGRRAEAIKLWLYALGCVATAGAYALWIALLDH